MKRHAASKQHSSSIAKNILSTDKNETIIRKIINCPHAFAILNGNAQQNDPCYDIVTSQDSMDFWQLPEPFVGNPKTARLVFISSNPSYDKDELFPTRYGPIDPVDFFINRFSSSHKGQKFVEGFCVAKNNESPKRKRKPVHFWTSMHKRACELFDTEDICPGVDYVYTEAVHCKSCNEKGMNKKAIKQCISDYLFDVLNLCTNARIFVLVGVKALNSVFPFFTTRMNTSNGHYTIDGEEEKLKAKLRNSELIPFSGSTDIFKKRYLIWLPHPSSSREVKKCTNRFSRENLLRIREIVNGNIAGDALEQSPQR